MKEPDGRAEQFARLRRLVVDGFMREDVPTGEVHPDFYDAVQKLSSLVVQPKLAGNPEINLICPGCDKSFATRSKQMKWCSTKCRQAFRWRAKQDENRD